MQLRTTNISGASLLAIALMVSFEARAQDATQPASAVPSSQSAASAQADIATEKPDFSEDIVVTANRREESAQRVPISITVLGGEDVTSRLRTSNQISEMVPNVQVSNNIGFGMPRTGIRGISQGDFNANATTSNMIYLDDVPLDAPMSQGVPLWDLQRVEVLRGPQGTLFGRNATGGAIRYIVALPSNEAEGFADLSVGKWGERTFNAAYGGPITDTLGVRISVVNQQFGGDIENVYLNERIGDSNYTGVRGVVVWKPTDQLTMTLRAQYFDGRMSVPAWKSTPGFTQPPLGFEPDAGPYATLAELQQAKGYQALGPSSDYYKYESELHPNEWINSLPISANIDYDLGFATLTSVSSYLKTNQRLLAENDSSPAIILAEYTRNNNRQYSQEVRLTSNGDGPFKWIAGAFYLNGVVNVAQSFDVSDWYGNVSYGFPGEKTVALTRGTRAELNTYAAFLHTTYNITPELVATAAIRYTHEKKDIDYRFSTFFAYQSLVAGTPSQINDFIKAVDTMSLGTILLAAEDPLSATKSFSNVSWKLGLDYQVTPGTLLYALVSRGFKGGAFNSTANFSTDILNGNGEIISVRPETLTDYEIGVKSDIIPRHLRVNGSLFYYDYRNYQTNQLIPALSIQVLTNLPKAKVYGAELELTARAIDNLTINIGAGLLHSEITEALDPALVGNRLPLAEDFNMNAMVRYDLETELGTFSPEISAKYVGSYFGQKENLKRLGNYALMNARIGYESPSKNFYGALWITNIADKMVPLSIDDVGEFWGSDVAYMTQHRRFGATFGVRF